MYLDLFGLILGRDFRSGLEVVPIMLMANVLLGINQNVSMWYKLSEKTNKAIIVTFSGLAVTLLVNIIFMPYYGYYAAAVGHLLCYTIMIIISYRLSLKHYPISYEWGRVGLYIFAGVLVYLVSLFFADLQSIYKMTINTVLFLIYISFILIIEKINPLKILKAIKLKISKK